MEPLVVFDPTEDKHVKPSSSRVRESWLGSKSVIRIFHFINYVVRKLAVSHLRVCAWFISGRVIAFIVIDKTMECSCVCAYTRSLILVCSAEMTSLYKKDENKL